MAETPPIAIVGMSVLFPGAPDLDTYWRNIVDGADSITEVPADRWDPGFYAPDAPARADRIYCRRGGFVGELAEVDVTGFGVMPSSVPGTEPDQLIALRVAAQAIADAGGEHRLPADRQRAGVILGRGGYLTPGLVRLDQRVRTAAQVVRTLGELMPELGGERLEELRQAFTDRLGPEAPEAAIGLVPNLAASRLANRLDLRGPAYTVDAACASSLVAVDHAVRELASGRCDVVLAGGVHHCHDVTFWSVFSQLGALSRSQRIRPFHKDADGVLIGEGTGVVVLKRLADAERDGDRVYAVVTGTGVASDGRTAGLSNPDSAGQVRAVRQAWTAAGIDPATIGLLEAHGTATPAGDAAELATIAEVFGAADVPTAVLGSVKSMIGHTMPAAGVAGLVKAALAVYHGVLPPTLHCEEPHPALDRTRFETLDAAKVWETDDRRPVRRAGVNAFGFGGINAHVVLEQAATRPAVEVREPERVLRLSAPTIAEMGCLLDRDDLLSAGEAGRGRIRLGLVEPTPKRLNLARKVVAKGRPWRGRNDLWFVPEPLLGPGGGKLAFVFPGLENEFEAHSDDIARHFGLRWESPDVTIGDVGRHGTGVFQLGRLLDTALRKLRVIPDALAGHSLGEWTAMAVAGIHADDEVDAFLAGFDPDALKVPGLAFAVIGAAAPAVIDVLKGQSEVVLSHDNAPNQSMICGPAEAVDHFVRGFRGEGVISQVLPFRSGFHTPMLAPYLGPIREAAERYSLHPAKLPVWSATTGRPYPAEPGEVRDLFVRHLLEPVRFRGLIDTMYAAGFRAFVQAGAGQLGSLIGNTLHNRDHLVVAAHSTHRPGLAQLLRVATALWAEGADPAVDLLPGQGGGKRGRAIRLDLGGALVSLDETTRRGFRPAAAKTSTLDRIGERNPLAAEFSGLLADTAGLAAELFAARPAPRIRPLRTELRVSVETMPYLLDHCFFRQPQGAEPADAWPVVPATTVIGHLMDFAEQAALGRRAVALEDVRLNQWIAATPALDVPVSVVPQGPSRVSTSLGEYSQAVIELADGFPPEPPTPWTFPVDAEETPDLRAEQLYTERWMFHGPKFQGVSELVAVGERHVRGVLRTPEAPGALLDNAGQLLGYWIMSRLPERTTVFPVGMRRIRFYGEHPVPGEWLDCVIRVVSVTDAELEADVQLIRGGRVWAEVDGWRDRRFDSNPVIRAVDRRPERATLSEARPEGWALVREQWPDLATRDLIMRNLLAGKERELYAGQPPRRKRAWLLGRIAAKDAIRRMLWADGEGDVFPAELRIGNDSSGAPVVSGAYGRQLPELTVSIAHRDALGVAIARPGPCGIDIEAVEERPRGTVSAALSDAELPLRGEPEALWFTRFWAAKEAVAKRLRTGLRGDPRAFTVVGADDRRLTVAVGGTRYPVWHTTISTPAKDYVVAWTENEDDH
ncbi:beta-ketoacyl synthase N-terminal-like domain-containing protein [Amycolatopsis pittospori]|uniref:beta-ketoacyl synthase N-terminal-like domain-containing protein n=1 Tax=Amycolatopsis pittospori TaxID=2749434 RepID=UPI0015EFFAB5|nr:beta-ketoacyl synthase N-terminal-like domain-containing protein [Amycolatopsis pittospori]